MSCHQWRYDPSRNRNAIYSPHARSRGTGQEGRGRARGGVYANHAWWSEPGPFTGRGPNGHSRSDQQIERIASDRLAANLLLDAPDIQVDIKDCIVVGFEQYHEPANELPEENRTFARVIVSLSAMLPQRAVELEEIAHFPIAFAFLEDKSQPSAVKRPETSLRVDFFQRSAPIPRKVESEDTQVAAVFSPGHSGRGCLAFLGPMLDDIVIARRQCLPWSVFFFVSPVSSFDSLRGWRQLFGRLVDVPFVLGSQLRGFHFSVSLCHMHSSVISKTGQVHPRFARGPGRPTSPSQ